MATKFDICSRALNAFGAETINSFTANTNESRICGLVYPQYIRYLQSMHPWRFTLKKVQLARLTTAPLNEWLYAYQLPSDLINLRALYDTSNTGIAPQTEFEIFQDKIYTDFETVYIDYQQEVGAEYFPLYFEEFAVDAIADRIVLSITDDKGLKQMMHQVAWGLPSDNLNGGSFGRAKKLDSMQNPSSAITADDLLLARFS